ncbi:MAG: hypothetical protein HY879_25175 [Deltaproteobacteria bacterium]|nr:hypothetical protein [Deltaproteobacteria bacterium]
MELITRFFNPPKGSFFRPADLRSLRSFKEEYPKSKTLLLYRGKYRLVKGDTLCLPCADFLAALHPDRLLNEVFTYQAA